MTEMLTNSYGSQQGLPNLGVKGQEHGMASTRGGGGAATQSGINYQNRVAAWMAVAILADQEAAPPWDLPADTSLKFLRCETEQPVDDLLVGTSNGGNAFIQVKHELELGKNPQSEFGKTLDQFVRQFLAYSGEPGNRPWERPLDINRDRLVLVTSSGSSASIREELPSLLVKVRELLPSQEISEAASSSAKLKAIFDTVDNLITIICQQNRLDALTSDEKRQLLCLMRVQILNVDAGGNEELQAKDRLRRSILAQPDQADAAWSSLINFCGELAVHQSGADQASLQKYLLKEQEPISLKPNRNYREDIERLQNYSQETARVLSEFSEIRVGDKVVKINRPVNQFLQSVAEQKSLLVIGDPGSGKSGTIYSFVEALNNARRDVVFLAVDKLEASSATRLREELELDHNLDEVLRQWQSVEPGWLVIDALDAARSAASVKTFRDLIATTIKLEGRWRVVVSIRKFDLRYSLDLQQLFRNNSTATHEFHDPEFENIQHINVTTLSNEELTQLESQSSHLAGFVARADNKLHELLVVPFNLRLVGDLIGAEVNPENLVLVKTQIELLDLYWSERVIRSDDGLGDAREALLRQAVERMVENRSLRVNRSEVITPSSSEATSRLLKEILSSQILTEWKPPSSKKFERSVLTFAHHVLFDYAVSCLILKGLPERAVRRLEREFDLVLAIRPSIVFYFQHLWFFDQSREEFWQIVLQILQTDAIPEIGKLIGPSVAADLIQNLADCEPLLKILEATPQPSKDNTIYKALSHLVGAILVDPSRSDRPLVGSDAPPWCELIERLSQSINLSLFFAVRPLLWNICEQSDKFTADQLALSGMAARKFFDFAWKENLSQHNFISRELEALCHTFASDVVDSARLIRKLLEPDAMESFGYTSIFWLANQLKLLIPHDAEFVKDIYIVAFNHQETSDTPTYLGSVVVSGISNRRQDFGTALYSLAKSYPSFLKVAPIQATRALVRILEGYVEQSHPVNEIIESKFDFDNREVTIRTDYSAVWDSSTYRDDYALQILDSFAEYLENLGSDSKRVAEYRSIISIIVYENRLAILWRCLLKCGAAVAETLGLEIRYLAWAVPILTSYDTTTLAGEFLRATFNHLSCSDREKVERSILSIPDISGDEFEESRQYVRNRLLGCLPAKALVTPEAKQILDELISSNGLPPNEDPFKLGEVTVTPYGEREYLSDLGVPLEEAANQRIQSLEEPVKDFSKQYLNSTPNETDIANIFPTLQALYEALNRAEADGVHPKQRDYAWGELAEACECITKVKVLDCASEIGVFVKQVLVEASEYPEPVYRMESDQQFNRFPSWGSPAARIDAAQGLTQLARHSTCVDEVLLNAIEQLSYDSVPAVRYQVAGCILSLHQTAPSLMWQIIERMCYEEINRGVLQGLLPRISRLGSTDGARVAELSKAIFLRIEDGDGSEKVREMCTSIFTGLFLWQNNPTAEEIISLIEQQLNLFHREAQRIIIDLREYLTIGSIPIADPLEDQVRQKAFFLVKKILQSALTSLQRLEAEHEQKPYTNWSEHEQQTVKDLAQVADTIAMEIYFASGAFDDKRVLSEYKPNDQDSEKRTAAILGVRGKERFLDEADSILDDLSTLGFPHLAHHLLETLVFLVDVDPKKILLKVGQAVHSSKFGSYQYDSLGADLIVRFIERFLAEYRYVLREDENCRRVLVEILDTFVQAGWTSARRLTYRMEEIFR